jgi:DNA-binding transcriptional LysR family regulator
LKKLMIQHPLTLDALRVLETIARRGSFAAAADELHRVTSAVSYTVQKLEEDLGIALFDRSGHRAKLTAAGLLLVERGRDLLLATAQLAEDARAVACGWEQRLTVAIDAVYPEAALLPLVERFYTHQASAATDASTDVRLISEVLGGPWDALESGRADIAIASAQFGPPKGMRARKLTSVVFNYVAAPQHRIFQEELTAEALENHRGIAVADSSRLRSPRSVRLGKHQPTLTVSSFTAKIAALEAGLGIGGMPMHLISEQLARGTLRVLPLPAATETVELVLAWQPDSSGRAKQWFLRHLPDFFAGLAPAQPSDQ